MDLPIGIQLFLVRGWGLFLFTRNASTSAMRWSENKVEKRRGQSLKLWNSAAMRRDLYYWKKSQLSNWIYRLEKRLRSDGPAGLAIGKMGGGGGERAALVINIIRVYNYTRT